MDKKFGRQNSPPEEGCPQGGVVDLNCHASEGWHPEKCSNIFNCSSGHQPSLVRQKQESFLNQPPRLLRRHPSSGGEFIRVVAR